MPPQQLKEYRQGDTIRLSVVLRDEYGVTHASTTAFLEGSSRTEHLEQLRLSGWLEGDPPTKAEIVLEGEVNQELPGVYECYAIAAGNARGAESGHKLAPPLCFRIVEHPDDVRDGPEVLSVGTFW
jgi:hypothetical protein